MFVSSRENLEAALRTDRGEQMFLFTESGFFEDPQYRQGSRTERIAITETQQRQQPNRVVRSPSLTITLSRSSLEQLRAGSPQQFASLLNLVRSFDDEKKNTTTVRAPPQVVQEIRQNTPVGRAAIQTVVDATRRSPRLNSQPQPPVATPTPLRRSARLNPS